MPGIPERRLHEFVDRRMELQDFCSMLERDDRPILAISGDTGIGKSSLLARFVHECALRHVVKVEIDCSSTRFSTYLAVMRKVRDDLGVEHFTALTDLINFFFNDKPYHLQVNVSTSGSIAVSQNVGTVEAGAVVAGVVIRDSMFVLPRQDLSVGEEERLAKLTDRFLADFERFLTRTPVVVFFDHLEKATNETRKWIWGELLGALAAGRLTGARFVLCDRDPPKLEEELSRIRDLVQGATLQPLGLPDITEYVARRDEFGMNEDERRTMAMVLLGATRGIPGNVATQVDSYVQLRRRSS